MKQVVASRIVEVPDNVKIEVKARQVRVKGDRGEPIPPCSEIQEDIHTLCFRKLSQPY